MKGRFKSPIWVIPVLAMVVALGAFAVMAGINQLSAQPAEASIQEPGQGLTSTANTEKLNEPFQSPLGFTATHVATGVTVDNEPQRAGSTARYTIDFDTTPGGQIDVGQEIIVRFGRHFDVPSSIDANQVTIAADLTTCEVDGDAIPSETRNPTVVTVTPNVGDRNQESDLRLQVPDMNTSDDCPGNDDIAESTGVTVIFSQGAGIANPSEGNDPGRPVAVRVTGDDAPGISVDVPVPWRVEMSRERSGRNTAVTLVGYGFLNGTTTTFWLDENGNGRRDGGERDLCSSSTSNNMAECTFNVGNPPFSPGTGEECDFDAIGDDFDCNFINAIDGDSRNVLTSTLFDEDFTAFSPSEAQNELDRTVYLLEGSVSVSPSEINTGDRVTVSLFDYPDGSVDVIRLGGVDITADTVPSRPGVTIDSNQESFTFQVPSLVAESDDDDAVERRIPNGTQRLRVISSTGENRHTPVTIAGASLTLSHETVIANQDLTISGSGFTERAGGEEVCIEEGNIRLANIELEFDNNDLDCGLEGVDGKRLSSGGTFTLTVRVRRSELGQDNGLDTSLLTAGSHELRVQDTRGAEGTLTVAIPDREIEVTPASARPRDVITIVGRGFPVDNPETGSVNIQVEYDCGVQSRTTSADPDGSGNFRETLRIPTNCSIPSTNTITADISNTSITETVTHEIPDAFVRVEPVRGAPGTVVTVEGEGFGTFTTVDQIEFAGRGTLGGRTVNTDGNGNFVVDDILIPGVDPGIRSVTVTVDEGSDRETTASTTFEILDVDVEGVPTDVIPGLAEPLGDNLVRAFYFNNTSKEWDFFDPRPEFEDANSLHELIEGQAIWVRVTEDQTVTLNNTERDLTCVNPGTPEEDCWNLIVW